MARPKSKLNQSSSEVIERNFLEELPPDVPRERNGLVISTNIPEMKKIQFINGRDPGYPLEFHYATKTHPLKHYCLHHGFEYELPTEIIDHLENCAEKVYGYRTGVYGHPEMYTKSLKYIFQCKTARRAA